MKGKISTIIFGFLFILAGRTAYGLSSFVGLIPNGSSFSCATCHSTPPALNPFGAAFLANGNAWGLSLATADSDGDTFTNGQELGDPSGTGTPTPGAEVTNPGDPVSKPAPGGTGPEITTQPASQTVASGDNVTLAVVAAGTGSLSYQWQKNGSDIAGATTANLTLNAVTAADAGSYTVVVSNAGGSVTSTAATLTVNAQNVGPVIATQPASQTVAPGANVTLAVVATGTAPLSYQWRLNGTDISGATDASLSLSNVQATDAGTYSVVVSNALGTATSSEAVLTVESGGTASFLKGNYNGLFFDPNGVAPESAGAFTINTTTSGKFSGKLQLGRSRHSLSGQFDQAGTAQKTITRRDKPSLDVLLQLDPADPDRITGTVSDGTFTADLLGDRAIFDGRQNVAPQAGRYTLVIPGASDSTTAPGGDSFGTVTIDRAGRIRLAGSLADATKISQTTRVSENGDWPLYISLYNGSGLIQSWLKFGATPNDLGGDVVWIKPEVRRAKLYPNGFVLATTASGSRYERPFGGNNVLTFTAGEVVLSGGGLGEDIVNEITLEGRNRVRNQSSNRLSLSFSTSTGTFSGRVTDPATSKTIRFSGVVLQRDNVGSGWFTGNGQSGKVTLRGL